MTTVSKMIQNRFGKTASIQTRLVKGQYKAELIFDIEEFGAEGLVRTGLFLSEQEAVNSLNKRLLHIMGDR